MIRTIARPAALLCLLAAGAVAAAAAAVREPSAKAASELVAAMKAQNLSAAAARDPDNPDSYVAAMLIPGVQLLVVAGKSTAPAYVEAQLAERKYSEVYSTLHSAVVADSKLFFQDMGADGLTSAGDGSVDILYEQGVKQTIFNGDWRGQKMSRAEYEQGFQKADEKYSRLLTILAQSLRTPTVGN